MKSKQTPFLPQNTPRALKATALSNWMWRQAEMNKSRWAPATERVTFSDPDILKATKEGHAGR